MTFIAELPWSSSRRNIEENYLSTKPEDTRGTWGTSARQRHQHRLICTGRPLHPKHHHIPGLMSHSIHEASKKRTSKEILLQRCSKKIQKTCGFTCIHVICVVFYFSCILVSNLPYVFQWHKSHQLIKSTHLRQTSKPRPETWRRRSTICTISPSTKNMAVPSSNGKPQAWA